MPFQGVVHANARKVIAHCVPHLPKHAHILCSGNFSIEATLRLNGYKGSLTGSDVSLYTCTLGAYFAGFEIPLGMNLGLYPEFAPLAGYMADQEGRAAVVAFALDALTVYRRKNLYQQRMWRHYATCMVGMVEKTIAKLRKRREMLKLDEFHAQDGWLRAHAIEPGDDHVVLTFPPTYCLARDEKVLTADLLWVPAGDLCVGNRLLSFDESGGGVERRRRWAWGTVTRSDAAIAECVRVRLRNGQSVVCTADHPWLADPGYGGPLRRWRRAAHLTGLYVLKVFDVWDSAASFEDGWLTGIIDGEGTLRIAAEAAALSIAQKAGPVASLIKTRLAGAGFTAQLHARDGAGMTSTVVGGGFPEVLRALGRLRPVRLLDKFQKYDISCRAVHAQRVLVEAVEPLGRREIQSVTVDRGTYVGAGYLMHNSGGYEKLYRDLGQLFEWDAPKYKILTTGVEFASRVTERIGRWIIGTEKRDQELDSVLGEPFAECPRDTQVRIHLYSNIPQLAAKVVRRSVNATAPPWPRLTDHDEILPTSRLSVHRVTSPQANYVRQVYASVEIGQASAQYSYAVAVDGKCIGILLFQEPTFGMKIEGEVRADTTIYMMADIAVASERYPRLSKLLLMASLSKELRHDLESRCVREIVFVVTTAFSRKPASMKYRGVYSLLTRKEENAVFVLNYYARAGKATLHEALASWIQKYQGEGKAA